MQPALLVGRETGTNPKVGAHGARETPVPIPNTEVKLSGAENTWLVTARKDREMPTQSIHPNGCFALYSSIAQSVERMTVNHDVTGSSPVGGVRTCRKP